MKTVPTFVPKNKKRLYLTQEQIRAMAKQNIAAPLVSDQDRPVLNSNKEKSPPKRPPYLTAQLTSLKKATNPFFKTTFEVMASNTETRLAITSLHELFQVVDIIEQTIVDVVKQEGDHFFVTEYRGVKALGVDRLGQTVLYVLRRAPKLFADFPQADFSPAVRCFQQELSAEKLWLAGNLKKMAIGEIAVSIVERLNTAVNRITQKVKSPRFKASHANFHRSAIKNLAAVRRYGDRLFHLHGSLLVIDLRLAYEWELFHDRPVDEAFKKVTDDWKKWIRRAKDLHQESMVGYARRIDFGSRNSLQIRALVFLTTKRPPSSGASIAKRLGVLWNNEITKGHGIHHNGNQVKSECHHTGCGTIHCTEWNKRAALDLIFQGLTKPDYLVKFLAPGSRKTFTKGDHPRRKAPQRGIKQKSLPSSPPSLPESPRLN